MIRATQKEEVLGIEPTPPARPKSESHMLPVRVKSSGNFLEKTDSVDLSKNKSQWTIQRKSAQESALEDQGKSSPRTDGPTTDQIILTNTQTKQVLMINTQVPRYRWVPDEEVSNCTACSVQFTAFTRKHHCRYCGNIFCSACVNQKAPLPEEYRYTSPQRVCKPCATKIQMYWHSHI